MGVPYSVYGTMDTIFATNKTYTVDEWCAYLRTQWKSPTEFASLASTYLDHVESSLRESKRTIPEEFTQANDIPVKHLDDIYHIPRCLDLLQKNLKMRCECEHRRKNFPTSTSIQPSLDVIVSNLAFLRGRMDLSTEDEQFLLNIALLSEVKYIRPFIAEELLYENIVKRGYFLNTPPYSNRPVTLINAKKFYLELADLYDFVYSIGQQEERDSYQTTFGVLEGLGLESWLVSPRCPTLYERSMRLRMYAHVFFLSDVQSKLETDQYTPVGPYFAYTKDEQKDEDWISSAYTIGKYEIGFKEQSFIL